MNTVSPEPLPDPDVTGPDVTGPLALSPEPTPGPDVTDPLALPPEPDPEPTGPLALVIEDDDDLCTVFFESLKASGFRPEVVQDGALGLERLQTLVPYLVVLDLHLPRVNGLKILKSLRADPRLTDTRVVVVTADPRMADDARPFSDITLIKPISFGLMREMSSRFQAFAARPKGGE